MQNVCGIDEAGRGALAGPLVAASVVLSVPLTALSRKAGFRLRDSKLLSARQREKAYDALRASGAAICVEVISARSINNHGIGWANREIMRRLVRKTQADAYILDGNLRIGRVRGKTGIVRAVVDADATVPEVIAAGIVAKVERDRIMEELHVLFPVFEWSQNKGYGTPTHLTALSATRMSRYHRLVFVATALRNAQKIQPLNIL